MISLSLSSFTPCRAGGGAPMISLSLSGGFTPCRAGGGAPMISLSSFTPCRAGGGRSYDQFEF